MHSMHEIIKVKSPYALFFEKQIRFNIQNWRNESKKDEFELKIGKYVLILNLKSLISLSKTLWYQFQRFTC